MEGRAVGAILEEGLRYPNGKGLRWGGVVPAHSGG